jgi:uncharacterized protein (TIGR02246 family)
MPTDVDGALQLLLDEREIRGLSLAFAGAIDRKEWARYAATFAEDATFDIEGQRRTGPEEIAAGPARDLAKFDRLQHHVTNQVVEVDGDTATGGWYAIAVHVPDAARPGEHADVGVRYRFTCARTDAGWRFTEVELRVVWSGGVAGFVVEDRPGDAA